MSLIFFCVWKLVEYSSSSLMSWLISILDTINRLHVFSTETWQTSAKFQGLNIFVGHVVLLQIFHSVVVAAVAICRWASVAGLQCDYLWLRKFEFICLSSATKYYFLSFSSIWKCTNHSWIVGHTEMDRIRPPSHSLLLSTAAGFLNMIYLVETYFPYLVRNNHLD